MIASFLTDLEDVVPSQTCIRLPYPSKIMRPLNGAELTNEHGRSQYTNNKQRYIYSKIKQKKLLHVRQKKITQTSAPPFQIVAEGHQPSARRPQPHHRPHWKSLQND